METKQQSLLKRVRGYANDLIQKRNTATNSSSGGMVPFESLMFIVSQMEPTNHHIPKSELDDKIWNLLSQSQQRYFDRYQVQQQNDKIRVTFEDTSTTSNCYKKKFLFSPSPSHEGEEEDKVDEWLSRIDPVQLFCILHPNDVQKSMNRDFDITEKTSASTGRLSIHGTVPLFQPSPFCTIEGTTLKTTIEKSKRGRAKITLTIQLQLSE